MKKFAILGNDIYVGGSGAASNGRAVVKYLKNNYPILLSDSTNSNFGSGIFCLCSITFDFDQEVNANPIAFNFFLAITS
jgi:hypothetical protein